MGTTDEGGKHTRRDQPQNRLEKRPPGCPSWPFHVPALTNALLALFGQNFQGPGATGDASSSANSRTQPIVGDGTVQVDLSGRPCHEVLEQQVDGRRRGSGMVRLTGGIGEADTPDVLPLTA